MLHCCCVDVRKRKRSVRIMSPSSHRALLLQSQPFRAGAIVPEPHTQNLLILRIAQTWRGIFKRISKRTRVQVPAAQKYQTSISELYHNNGADGGKMFAGMKLFSNLEMSLTPWSRQSPGAPALIKSHGCTSTSKSWHLRSTNTTNATCQSKRSCGQQKRPAR